MVLRLLICVVAGAVHLQQVRSARADQGHHDVERGLPHELHAGHVQRQARLGHRRRRPQAHRHARPPGAGEALFNLSYLVTPVNVWL